MYYIIGGDQQEYGPLSADQIRQWIAEGRLNAQTQVRLADSTQWQPLTAFPELAGPSAPAPLAGAPVAAAGGAEDARRRVSGPAIALLVTGILGVPLQLYGLVMHLASGGRSTPPMPMLDPNLQRFFQVMNGPLGLVLGLVGLVMTVLIILGALKMKNLRSYQFAYVMSILAMIPCLSPCCLLGLPFGIWALVVLSKPEIKAQFS
jgi:hypothetical protein